MWRVVFFSRLDVIFTVMLLPDDDKPGESNEDCLYSTLLKLSLLETKLLKFGSLLQK